jgi:hypothetical protein
MPWNVQTAAMMATMSADFGNMAREAKLPRATAGVEPGLFGWGRLAGIDRCPGRRACATVSASQFGRVVG